MLKLGKTHHTTVCPTACLAMAHDAWLPAGIQHLTLQFLHLLVTGSGTCANLGLCTMWLEPGLPLRFFLQAIARATQVCCIIMV